MTLEGDVRAPLRAPSPEVPSLPPQGWAWPGQASGIDSGGEGDGVAKCLNSSREAECLEFDRKFDF